MSAPLARLGSGLIDPETFTGLYEEALPRVFGYFVNRCGGIQAVAEELTQETFFAAVAELQRGREVELPLPWLLGIARHKLVDHYRREERQRRRLVAVEDEIPRASEPVAWEGPAARERATEALAAVGERQRAALVLRYMDGLSVPQVAEALGTSVHATESLLARGRETFRRAYSESDHAD